MLARSITGIFRQMYRLARILIREIMTGSIHDLWGDGYSPSWVNPNSDTNIRTHNLLMCNSFSDTLVSTLPTNVSGTLAYDLSNILVISELKGLT